MTQFRAEVYNKAFDFIGHMTLNLNELNEDYISPKRNKFIVKGQFNAKRNSFIRILADEQTYCEALIYDVSYNGITSEVEFIDFNSIFDRNIYNETSTGSVESQLKALIEALYLNNEDTLENMPIEVRTASTTDGTLATGLVNLHKLIVDALKNYNIVVSHSFDYEHKKIIINIHQVINEVKYIETSLADIYDVNITAAGSKSNFNKITYLNEQDSSQKAVYYLTFDNEVTKQSIKRIEPVISDTKLLKCDTEKFEETALQDAEKSLMNTKYNQLIEVLLKKNSKIYYDFEIGQSYKIVVNDVIYDTVLSGIKKTEGLLLLTFGLSRIDLTEVLKERI